MIVVERVCLDGRTTKLDEYALNHNGCKENHNEPLVIEETGEHVQFSFANLTRVDQVEDLHEHKYLENYSIMKHLLCWSHRLGFLWEMHGRGCKRFPVCITCSSVPNIACLESSCLSIEAVVIFKQLLIIFIFWNSSFLPNFSVFTVDHELVCVEWVPRITLRDVGHLLSASSPVVFGQVSWYQEDTKCENDNLENCMTEDISPHYIIYN